MHFKKHAIPWNDQSIFVLYIKSITVDTARTGVYNLEKSNFRRILHVKCYCNGEKCKVNIAGWTFSVRFSCIVLSEQQVPAAVVIQGRLYGRPVIFAPSALPQAVTIFLLFCEIQSVFLYPLCSSLSRII